MKHSAFLADEAALLAFAGCLAQSWLKQPEAQGLVIWLRGDLGAGKTTFARGFLRGLGYEGVVKSPTYTLVEPYEPVPGRFCYHFDLYRLADAEELEFTGARDYFDDQSLCLIEWPEKAAACLPAADLECSLVLKNKGRQISLHAGSDRGCAVLSGAIGDDLL
jgi:tRNA threonylcarbamoyladenosine biosynthesis protein TsaE